MLLAFHEGSEIDQPASVRIFVRLRIRMETRFSNMVSRAQSTRIELIHRAILRKQLSFLGAPLFRLRARLFASMFKSNYHYCSLRERGRGSDISPITAVGHGIDWPRGRIPCHQSQRPQVSAGDSAKIRVCCRRGFLTHTFWTVRAASWYCHERRVLVFLQARIL